MWHATCMQGNHGDFRLLVVESQIGNLTLSLSFGTIYVLSVQMSQANPF
jgi:hypothetical protein